MLQAGVRRVLMGAAALFLVALWTGEAFALGEQMLGRITGEKCVTKGKFGECYLKDAFPMVFLTEDGKWYRVESVGDVGAAELDKAFGKNVLLEGWTTENKVSILSMKVLEAGKKEFFKG
ncbi:MAG: hypothetical protein HY039_06500 [Nitrospirae bacterium]|nr:hypothetical protein [Nitrospirota bacterium]